MKYSQSRMLLRLSTEEQDCGQGRLTCITIHVPDMGEWWFLWTSVSEASFPCDDDKGLMNHVL